MMLSVSRSRRSRGTMQEFTTFAGALHASLLLALPASGCSQENGTRTGLEEATASPLTPTWHEQIAPLVTRKCGACHREGGIGPFSVLSYGQAKPMAQAMASAVERGSMPPFLAQETAECTPRNKYANDPRLTPEEKTLLRAWADSAAPEGDANRAAPVSAPLPTRLPREDVVVTLPEPIRVEQSARGDIHTCVILDPKLDRDVYVSGRQITSGNDAVLHHVVAYMIKPQKTDGTLLTRQQVEEALLAAKKTTVGGRYDCFGGPGLEQTALAFELLNAWAPGTQPVQSPNDSGQPMPKDSLVVMYIHYHSKSTGPEEDHGTKLALMLTPSRPSYIARPLLLGNFEARYDSVFGFGELVRQDDEVAAEFKIPAGAVDHVEEMKWTWTLPISIRVYYSATHMHYVGHDMMVQLENSTPDPGEEPRECLVHTPHWDYNWQRGYGYEATYDQLPSLRDGDVLRIRCRYDNTRGNKFLAQTLDERGLAAPVDVKLGADTLDEMCLAGIGVLYPNTQP